MSEFHLIVISSVRPEATSAGQIILYRHLVGQSHMTLEIYGMEPNTLSPASLIRRLVGRVGRTQWHRLAENFWTLWQGRWLDSHLPKRIARPEKTVVITVAHGDGCYAAWRFAQKHGLPLVVWFQDWWPDMAGCHSSLRPFLESRYRAIYRDSDAAIGVSQGMLDALGHHNNAHLLYPVSAQPRKYFAVPAEIRNGPFKVIYSGNLTDYGPMLGHALEASLTEPDLLLQVRGANPTWPEATQVRMKENGRWLEFAPRHELDAWLASADAFLIPMVFDPAARRRMETSFPSKLIEFAQFGKPLIIWGPGYCSAIRWAREGDKAFCVNDSDPKLLVREIVSLLHAPDESRRYAEAASRSAAAEFNPDSIQREFRDLLERLINLGQTRLTGE